MMKLSFFVHVLDFPSTFQGSNLWSWFPVSEANPIFLARRSACGFATVFLRLARRCR